MAHDGKGNIRYKVNGQFVYLPKRTKAEQAEIRKQYMKEWCQNNPDKVKANLDRHYRHRDKVLMEKR